MSVPKTACTDAGQPPADRRAGNIIEASLDPVFKLSSEGKITDLNEAAVRLTGVSRELLAGSDFSNYFTQPENARECCRLAFASGSAAQYPLSVRDEDGKSVDLLCNAAVYKDADGGIAGVLAVVRDLTEFNRIIREYADTKNFLNNILQSSIKYSIIGIDSGRRILSWNEGARRNYGYASEDVIGRDTSILHTPEDINSGVVENLYKAVDKDGMSEGELLRVRKDGSRFIAAVVITRRLDTAGAPIGYLLISSDITEKKRSEERLQHASQYARSLIEASLDPLVTISSAGKITDVNEATIRVTGVSRWQLIGTDFSDYFTQPEKAREGYMKVFAEEYVTDYPLTIRHRDGRLTEVLYNASVYKDAGGKVMGVFAAARDLTEIKKAEKELAEQRKAETVKSAELAKAEQAKLLSDAANKELEAFCYSVSHDLRAPLRHASGYVDLLIGQFRADLPEKALHYLNTIVDSVHKMDALINDLLQFSRNSRVEMRRTVVDMAGILRTVMEPLVQDNPGREIEWIIGRLPRASGDGEMLKLVWANLIGNAIKFTRTKPRARIEVGFSEEEAETVFFVRDNGVGFDMNYAKNLFGVFQRLHPSEEFEGTGIGLANVRRIIHRHGGRTWAEAELDKGAVFYFSLPKEKP
ncbi:MAG: PAS domain S-box protein [Elusimicrobiales bacterium]